MSKALEDAIIKALESGPKKRTEIIELISKEQPVRKSSFSDATTALKRKGIINDFKRGEDIQLLYRPASTPPALTPETIRKWLILYYLYDAKNQKEGLETRQIFEKMNRFNDEYKSENTIYQDIQDLLTAGMVQKTIGPTIRYRITDKAPLITKVPFDRLYSFLLSYKLGISSNIKQEIADRLLHLFEFDDCIIRLQGRDNIIDQKIIDNLMKLMSLPYQTKKVVITQTTNMSSHITIAVGLIFYNFDTNDFYIAGKVKSRNRNMVKLLKLSNISDIEESPYNNDVYASQEFIDYKNKSLGMDYESSETVELLFRESAETRLHIEQLEKLRDNIRPDVEQNGKSTIQHSYIVPGLNNLKRILRIIGPDVLVTNNECNQKLITEMNETIDRVKKRYMETNPSAVDLESFKHVISATDPGRPAARNIANKFVQDVYDRMTLLLSFLCCGSGIITIKDISEAVGTQWDVIGRDIVALTNTLVFKKNITVGGNIVDDDVAKRILQGKCNDSIIILIP